MAYTLSVPEGQVAADLVNHLSSIGEMEHILECDGSEGSKTRTCVGCWAWKAEQSLSRQMMGIKVERKMMERARPMLPDPVLTPEEQKARRAALDRKKAEIRASICSGFQAIPNEPDLCRLCHQPKPLHYTPSAKEAEVGK